MKYWGGPRFRAARLLPVSLVLLVSFAMLPVLLLGWTAVSRNTAELLAARYEVAVGRVSDVVQASLGATRRACEALAGAVAEGRLASGDLIPASAAVQGLAIGLPEVIDVREEAAGDPGWSFRHGGAASFRCVSGDDSGIVVSVSLGALSAALRRLSDNTAMTPFVLRGLEQVIAHPTLSGHAPGGPPPSIWTIGDPVLAAIWAERRPLLAPRALQGIEGHWAFVGGVGHTYLWRAEMAYGDPLLIGAHVAGHVTRRERLTRWLLLGAGLLALTTAALAMVALGRAIAHPVRAIARSAEAMERLDFHHIAHAQLHRLGERTHLAEFATTAAAMARLARAMTLLETLAPRALVRRLIAAGEGVTEAEEREVSLLFLDLEGYSRFADGRPPSEVAGYLNALFARIGPPIEASGGTIDKYTGDGLLAFWGAPGDDPDHVSHAIEAVAALATVMEADPAMPPCRLRAGLHVAQVLVGMIGYPGRMDYTVVGRGVNLAQRAQAALRGVSPAERIVVAATDAFVERMPVDKGWVAEPHGAAAGEAIWRMQPRASTGQRAAR